MLFQNLLLIIRQLQTSADFAVANQREIILEYRKHEALNDYIEQDKIDLCPEKEGGVISEGDYYSCASLARMAFVSSS